MNYSWKERLRGLPNWASAAMARFDRPFDYIAYRLAENVDEFKKNVQPELERMLPGTRDLNSH